MKKYVWFAFYLVKTDKGWVWWESVIKIIDDRPEKYLGLLPEISYQKL